MKAVWLGFIWIVLLAIATTLSGLRNDIHAIAIHSGALDAGAE